MSLPSADILEQLYARFLLNLPEEDLSSTERMMFSVEEAHWFYEDHLREEDPCLKRLTLRDFTRILFNSCQDLSRYKDTADAIYASFQTFKATVPVLGAILLAPDLEHVLLVRGCHSGAAWSFPRGKRGKDETDVACAIREVREETGFDISTLLRPEKFIDISINQRQIKLYIITGVGIDTPFAAQTKGEIGDIKWFRISDLRTCSERFFCVWPFIKRLKSHIMKMRAHGALPNGNSSVDSWLEEGVQGSSTEGGSCGGSDSSVGGNGATLQPNMCGQGGNQGATKGRRRKKKSQTKTHGDCSAGASSESSDNSQTDAGKSDFGSGTASNSAASGHAVSPMLTFQLDAKAIMRCLAAPV
eukprot:CAMPEP_0177621522 /NCGR_PEP_ID=MMETSP0419_2-20121207/27631_1 /TAXON_ID=582737 /ORGANISM="Tetraselmis sp., Strain GSL018" /LENGTH=358 /DNA_ID=CAMNT_0019121447 /DNA_START=58 /DNA_END=1134 /DNA_ORIENTATION=+